MKIFICTSKAFYSQVPPIQEKLEAMGHIITLPNSIDNPTREFDMKDLGEVEHRNWKADMLRLQVKKVTANDAILVLNMKKNGQANYVGGATFLEMYKAFELGKKIFLYNPIPDGMLRDEISAFGPIIINQDLTLIL